MMTEPENTLSDQDIETVVRGTGTPASLEDPGPGDADDEDDTDTDDADDTDADDDATDDAGGDTDAKDA